MLILETEYVVSRLDEGESYLQALEKEVYRYVSQYTEAFTGQANTQETLHHIAECLDDLGQSFIEGRGIKINDVAEFIVLPDPDDSDTIKVSVILRPRSTYIDIKTRIGLDKDEEDDQPTPL